MIEYHVLCSECPTYGYWASTEESAQEEIAWHVFHWKCYGAFYNVETVTIP